MAKSRTEIFVNGVNDVEIRELTSGGAGTTYTDVGHVKKVVIADAPDMVESKNSAGEFINDQVGADNTRFVVTLMQASKAVIDILRNARGKYYDVYMRANLPNGNIQEIVMAPVKLMPKVGLDFGASTERDVEMEIVCLKPKAGHTRAPVDYNNNAADGPYYYVLIETATTPKGLPSDTVGTVYTAVM